jgi:hypothetical protein
MEMMSKEELSNVSSQKVLLPPNTLGRYKKNLTKYEDITGLSEDEIIDSLRLWVSKQAMFGTIEEGYDEIDQNVHMIVLTIAIDISNMEPIIVGNLVVNEYHPPQLAQVLHTEDLDEDKLTELNNELSKYDYFLYLEELEIKPEFRKFGLMNYMIQKLFQLYGNKTYLCHINYGSYGESPIDNALLKRFYNYYGFIEDRIWVPIINSLYRSHNSLVKTNP